MTLQNHIAKEACCFARVCVAFQQRLHVRGMCHSQLCGMQILDQIVPEIGRMVQYQSYNTKNPLNPGAAKWAEQNIKEFPIDERNILNADHLLRKKGQGALVELENPEDESMSQVVEFLDEDDSDQANPAS